MKAKSSKDFGPILAIVPVNVPRKSKVRLSSLLRPPDRARLTIAMLSDVLSALRGSRTVLSTLVVSADRSVHRIAGRFGAQFVWEGGRRGLNKGLRLAIEGAEQKGASAVLVIHADLPLLTSREIDRFLIMSQSYPVALAPSKDGAGTNALLLSPPRVIQPAFGKGSFSRHVKRAKRRGLPCKVLRFRGICFDVDEPRDLHKLMRHRLHNKTSEFLHTLHSQNQFPFTRSFQSKGI